MRVLRLLDAALVFAEDPAAAVAAVRWPKFSVTSYRLVTRLAAQGVRPRTVIDVGANVGQFAVAAAKLFPQAAVHAFEPVPETADRLRANVRSLDRVTVYPLALGPRAARADIRVNRHSHSSSLLPLAALHRKAFPDAEELGRIEVEVSTLDHVLGGLDLAPPVLLKLDVQGYELAVLGGGREVLTRTDHVVLECSFEPLYEGEPRFTELLVAMRESGFTFERPVSCLADPRDQRILQMDALFRRGD